jgi:hypothetical protein
MEGETPNLHELLLKVSESPMLKYDPSKYFERATLIFMQFSCMSQKINENHMLLRKLTKQMEECQHLLRKIAKKI